MSARSSRSPKAAAHQQREHPHPSHTPHVVWGSTVAEYCALAVAGGNTTALNTITHPTANRGKTRLIHRRQLSLNTGQCRADFNFLQQDNWTTGRRACGERSGRFGGTSRRKSALVPPQKSGPSIGRRYIVNFGNEFVKNDNRLPCGRPLISPAVRNINTRRGSSSDDSPAIGKTKLYTRLEIPS